MSEQRERAINAPASVVLLIGTLLAVFAVQSRLGTDAVAAAWAFAPRNLEHGRYVTLVTALFLHGGWAHVLGNSAFALAFATPVARRLGDDAPGVAAFFAFYLVCGVLGNLGYAVANLGGDNPVLGASGAIAGMMGAASRLIGQRPGALAPFNSRSVVGMGAAWVIVNVVFGLLLPGWMPGTGGAPIAWQAHLAGYAAGLVLFEPLLRVIGRQDDHAMEN